MATRSEEFEGLVRNYSRVIASAIRRVCGRSHGALIADVEQEVYTALWRRLQGGKDIEHPVSYLYKMALTTALAVVRKNAPETVASEIREETLPSDAGDGFGGLLPAERSRLLAEVLEQLPAEQARAVRAHLAGFSHMEVAALYGWSGSVARHRIYRGIGALREKMKGRGHEQAAGRRR